LSYFLGEFRPEIIRDLRLKDLGLELIVPDPTTFGLFRDGTHVLLWRDLDRTIKELKSFAPRDVEAFLSFGLELKRYSDLITPTLMREPPTLTELDAIFAAPDDKRLFMDFMSKPAADYLNERFESENLKGLLAFMSVASQHIGPDAPGSGVEFAAHSCAEIDGEFGVWGHVKGGMGALSDALRVAAERRGAVVETGCTVEQIVATRSRVEGVQLADGSIRRCKYVVSNADPHVTFTKLAPRDALPAGFRDQAERIDFRGAMARVHYAVEELPRWKGVTSTSPGPEHVPLTLIDFTLPRIREAVTAYLQGRLPDLLALELATPSAVDPTLAPPGKHVVTIGVQYTPFKLATGSWDDYRDEFERRVRDTLDEFAPGFSKSILGHRVITPLDLEREYSLTGGNIFHGSMVFGQWFSARPLPGWGNYRAPIQGLYLCGAGTHPGGGVIGANGHNAAMAIRRDSGGQLSREEWLRRAHGDRVGGDSARRDGRSVVERAWSQPSTRALMMWAARQKWSRAVTRRLRRKA
jgi:phytoene dehydrogenase-like protein